MKKNILILVLSLALILCVGKIASDQWSAAQMRATVKVLLAAHSGVWKGACQHAAAGIRDRSRWCDLADRETALGSDEIASDEDMKALALECLETKTGKR
jgi:hypothetical protein